MAMKITITYQKKNYDLEFSRTTAGQIEDQGFVLEQISEKPVKMIPLLFYGAFLKHNRGISRKLAYKLLAEKEIQAVKVGRTYKIPKICIIEYLLGEEMCHIKLS